MGSLCSSLKNSLENSDRQGRNPRHFYHPMHGKVMFRYIYWDQDEFVQEHRASRLTVMGHLHDNVCNHRLPKVKCKNNKNNNNKIIIIIIIINKISLGKDVFYRRLSCVFPLDSSCAFRRTLLASISCDSRG